MAAACAELPGALRLEELVGELAALRKSAEQQQELLAALSLSCGRLAEAFFLFRVQFQDLDLQHRLLCDCLHKTGLLHRKELLQHWQAQLRGCSLAQALDGSETLEALLAFAGPQALRALAGASKAELRSVACSELAESRALWLSSDRWQPCLARARLVLPGRQAERPARRRGGQGAQLALAQPKAAAQLARALSPESFRRYRAASCACCFLPGHSFQASLPKRPRGRREESEEQRRLIAEFLGALRKEGAEEGPLERRRWGPHRRRGGDWLALCRQRAELARKELELYRHVSVRSDSSGASTPRGPSSAVVLRPGDRIQVLGLSKRDDLNGLGGKCHSYIPSVDRWLVLLENGEAARVRRGNLRPAPEAEPAG